MGEHITLSGKMGIRMKPKAILKVCVDVLMTLLFLVQMGYHMVGNRVHEWVGVSLCLLFLLHHA